MSPDIPSVIEGYRVEGVLGRGASGVVLRVRDRALDRTIALKLLTDDHDEEARARFFIEAKAAARIIHPNVVQVFAAGSHEGRSFITQELVDGYPLSMLLEVNGTLSPAAVVDVAIQAASGLARAADVGVLHRDVKPQNLLITEEGLVKLADFGIAKILGAPSELTESGTTLGTPHYMSPEQGQGRELDPRSDQYSLGATLYHLICGQPPFDDENALTLLLKHKEAPLLPVRELAPDCPEALAVIVERMLKKDPDDRFASFVELVEALESIGFPEEEHKSIRGLLDGVEKTEPQVDQPRVPAWAINAAVVCCAISVIGAAVYGSKETATTGALKAAVREEAKVEVAPVPRKPPTREEKPAPRKPRSRFEVLIEDLQDPKTAAAAARALGELGDQRATDPLIEAARSSKERIAVAALDALGELGDIDAIEPLEELAIGGRTQKIRDAAERAKNRLYSVEE
jgi:serine/threonine-protein kinase